MSAVTVNYKGESIATFDASATKTLDTSGKYCEDDIEIVYTEPSTPTPENISITLKNGKASGSMEIYSTQYDADLGVVISKHSTRTAGSDGGYSMLKQGNYIGLGLSVAISSVTYDNEEVAFSQTGSSSNRPTRIEIPNGYTYGTPIILA